MDVVGDVSPWDDSALVDREGLSQVGKDVRRHCFREQAVIRVGHCDRPGVFRRVVQDFGDEDPQRLKSFGGGLHCRGQPKLCGGVD